MTTRTYKGSLAKATVAYQRDADAMAREGWFPSGQTYAPGSWGCAAFLLALLLCVVLVGILIFIYMLIVKPDGVLVVTYAYRGGQVAAADGGCPMTFEGQRCALAADHAGLHQR
ncbi:MAG TPA: hypothetical protein VIO16_01430 [Dehalococcoidia bacterium]